ncbi:MAG: hypothetical protein EOO11_08065 [Chitinophagaceae bacterium]|nr:MAG: hypothetical protein EOO11_08065 [Chitinophagaceae bacterium]
MKLLQYLPSERSVLRALYVLVLGAFLWADRAGAPLQRGDTPPVARKATKEKRPYVAARAHR